MTTWFERRAGSEETLLALYDAVGAAEEVDLAEQAHMERLWADVRALYDTWPSDEAEEIDDVGAADLSEAHGDTERLSMSHAVGIVEHLLGGRPMRGGEPSAS